MATPTRPSDTHRTTRDVDSTASQVPGTRSWTTESTGDRLGRVALNLLRLALGVEFLWAFLDKTFGLGYATPSAKAWIHGGSPTKGFLSGVAAGPLKGFYNSIAGAPLVNWLFMLGLLGIGVALILGVVLRIAAASGAVLLMMMWLATWPPATMAGGQPTGSTNPIVDEHVISALAIIVVGALVTQSSGYLGPWWAHHSVVARSPWLR